MILLVAWKCEFGLACEATLKRHLSMHRTYRPNLFASGTHSRGVAVPGKHSLASHGCQSDSPAAFVQVSEQNLSNCLAASKCCRSALRSRSHVLLELGPISEVNQVSATPPQFDLLSLESLQPNQQFPFAHSKPSTIQRCVCCERLSES